MHTRLSPASEILMSQSHARGHYSQARVAISSVPLASSTEGVSALWATGPAFSPRRPLFAESCVTPRQPQHPQDQTMGNVTTVPATKGFRQVFAALLPSRTAFSVWLHCRGWRHYWWRGWKNISVSGLVNMDRVWVLFVNEKKEKKKVDDTNDGDDEEVEKVDWQCRRRRQRKRKEIRSSLISFLFRRRRRMSEEKEKN